MYLDTLKVITASGVGYSDFLRMNLNEVRAVLEGYSEKRVDNLNNLLTAAHMNAHLTKLAIYDMLEGTSYFPKEPILFELHSGSVVQKEKTKEEVIAELAKFNADVWKDIE